MFAFLTNNRKQNQQQQLVDSVKLASRTTDPLKLTDLLLSNRPLADKVRLLFALPLKAVHDKTGMRLLESQLEERDRGQLAQAVRWLEFCNKPKERRDVALEWSEHIIKGDIVMRWMVQRGIYLREEARALQKSLVLDDKTEREARAGRYKLKDYEDELRHLNDGYWEMSRELYLLEANIPDGALKRAFESCRADPEWYLSQWLREDCARRGGCCGRDCGCCEKARTNHYEWNRGHCTKACGCCLRKKQCGDEAALSNKNESEMDDVDIASRNSPYGIRLFRAYIWGLSALDELNLLD